MHKSSSEYFFNLSFVGLQGPLCNVHVFIYSPGQYGEKVSVDVFHQGHIPSVVGWLVAVSNVDAIY